MGDLLANPQVLRPHQEPRTRRRRVRDFLGRWLVGTVVLTLTFLFAPGMSADGLLSIPFAVLITAGMGRLLRPLLIRIARPLGWFGAVLLALFANAITMYVGLELTPGIEDGGPWQVFVASWIYAFFAAVFEWLLLADADDAFYVHVIRLATKRGLRGEETDEPGVVIVQLDGLPAPVLEWGVKSGNFPTLARWVRDGSHTWHEWRASLPSTTPVSQAGILHGRNDDMPAFRWYEKDLGRLVVSNHPPDAALIESRISDGTGLLADEGVSISNLFSGDAPTSLLTMSGLRGSSGIGPSSSFAAFFTHPYGFLRATVLTLGEMVKETFQARRQRTLGIEPRVARKGAYVALRGVTNVMLRDLNTALVVEAMLRGAKVVYVDYVDYDEIAHHAGVVRAESLRAIEGVDQVLDLLERAASQAPRPYRFVVVSDHGQSQGATFRQRYGQGLDDLVRDHLDDPALDGDREGGGETVGVTSSVEDWGPLNTFLSQLTSQTSVTGRLGRKVLRGRRRDGAVALGPSEAEAAAADAHEGEEPEVVVIGSGNLGGVWLAREPGRLTLEEVNALHPRLVPALATHPGIAFVLARSEVHGPVVLGRTGVRRLADGIVEGDDPLGPFDARVAAELLRLASFSNAPDLVVNSLYDPMLDEVAAFEELVGCHGGAGGWQTRAVLVQPSDWTIDDDLLTEGEIVGPVALHRHLVRRLRALGHREGIDDSRALAVATDLRALIPPEPAGTGADDGPSGVGSRLSRGEVRWRERPPGS